MYELYMFSDGYIDQFGGNNNEKFNIKRFKRMLLEIHEKDIEEQEKIISTTMKKWKGEQKQIDDILVIGIKL